MEMPENQRNQLRDILFASLDEFMGNPEEDQLPDDINPNALMHFGEYDSLNPYAPHEDRPPFAMWRNGIGSYPVIFHSYKDLIDWVDSDMNDNECKAFALATWTAMGKPTSELWACALSPNKTPMPWDVRPLKTKGGYAYVVIIFSPQ